MTPSTKLKPWKILNSLIVHQTPWIKIIQDHCLVEDQKIDYTYTKRTDGALIIAETKDKKLWLVRQYRHPIKKIVWQFAAEGQEDNENLKQTAIRGLKEELSLTAKNWIQLGQDFYPDPGSLDQTYQMFLAKDLEPLNFNPQKHPHDEVEDLEIKAFSRNEIEKMIKSGEICDNWTLAALFLYDRYNARHN